MTVNPVPLVLIVESDPVQRDLMQLTLSRIGCEVINTREPQLVSAIVAKQHPSLIILDTFIPGSSGLTIVKELIQKKLLKHTAVIFVSSYGFTEVIQQVKEIGINEFLMKPLNIEDFCNRVRYLLKI
jgi:DNA-binding response OmpR family regulator